MSTLPDSAQNDNTQSDHTSVPTTSQTIYSIYQFLDPRTNEVVYIGLTKNPSHRFKEHVAPKGKLHSLAQELAAAGLQLATSILETTTDLQEARELEKKWIQTKMPLLNCNHNQEGYDLRREREWCDQQITLLMHDKGWTYREASLYMQEFGRSMADAYTYEVIEESAQVTSQYLGRTEPLTHSEILKIALKYRGIEVRG